jgi:hypothetical protein
MLRPRFRNPLAALAAICILGASPALAQHEGHVHSAEEAVPADSTSPPPMDHAGHHEAGHESHHVPGMVGDYDGARDASGTAWQPSSSGHEGIHSMRGAWHLMLHGFILPAATTQGGNRGDDDVYASTMIMARAIRDAGPGRLAIRTMLSADPGTIGNEGYPLLLQTGETSDGATPLIDRQHPHDLFMELAASYALVGRNRSLFLYGALAGEPALGPPVFMHRRSGIDIPEAPISHHWLDSSHITFGVVTAGALAGPWKLESSAFRGREPDHERWNLEEPKLDSWSVRLSWNPSPAWAVQASYGELESPEELHPETDVERTTATVIYNRPSASGNWQTTIAWGRNRNLPGLTLDAFLVESAVTTALRHTFLGRIEFAEKDELFLEEDPLHGRAFDVARAGVGYLFDASLWEHAALGFGVYGTVSLVPEEIEPAYGSDPISGTLFARLKIR